MKTRKQLADEISRDTLERARLLIQKGGITKDEISFVRIAKDLDLPVSTLKARLRREGITNAKELKDMCLAPEIQYNYEVTEEDVTPKVGKREVGENVLEYYAQNIPHIQTPEQLIEHTKIDLDKYDIIKQEPRKWDVVMKLRTLAEDGVTVIERPKVFQSFYVSFTAIPKKMVAVEPELHPIRPEHKIPKVSKKMPASGRCVIVEDAQIGFLRDTMTGYLTPMHDRDALEVLVQYINDTQPDMVVIIGDFVDFADISSFFKEPEFYFTMQPTIFEANYWMWRISKAAPNARKVFLVGNHEERFQKNIKQYLMQMYRLHAVRDSVAITPMTLEFFLGADVLGWEWIDDYPNGSVRVGNVRLEHGNKARAKSGATTNAVLDVSSSSVAIGHIHRTEITGMVRIDADGTPKHIWGACFGCLSHLDGRVPGHVKTQNWNQGFGVIEWHEDFAQPIPYFIHNGKLIANQKVYQSKFDVADLNKRMEAILPDRGFKFSV